MINRRSACVLALAIAALVLGGCARSEPPRATVDEREDPASNAQEPASQADKAPESDPVGREPVTVFFPSAADSALVGETREIFKTTSPGDRAKQILSELLSGPATDAAVAAVPAGTRLRQVYVLASGVAYADFSGDLVNSIGGGSDTEILTVYSIVDSLLLNVPELKRVGILIDGRPCETLNGHLDLRRPLPANRSLVPAAAEGAAPPSEGSPVTPEGQPPTEREPAPLHEV